MPGAYRHGLAQSLLLHGVARTGIIRQDTLLVNDVSWGGRLQASGIKLATLGMFGPLEGTNEAMQLNVDSEHHWFHQSVAFVVAEKPQTPMKPWQDISDGEATGRSLTAAKEGHAAQQLAGKDSASQHTADPAVTELKDASFAKSAAGMAQSADKSGASHSTVPSSKTKDVDGQHFNLPGTEHAAGPHQTIGKEGGAESAGRSHRAGGSQRVTLKSHTGPHGSHEHKHRSR